MPLHYTQSGEKYSGPPLVLLHGFCETNEIWSGFRESLGSQIHILCPDLPGFGRSPLPTDEISTDTAAFALRDWLLNLGIESCILAGHSLGGYVSLAFLEHFPDMTEGICLFNSTALADTEEKKRTRNNVITFVEKHGVEKFITSFVPPLFSQQNRERLKPQINELIFIASNTPKESVIAYTRAMQQRPDRLSVLEISEKPVLYITGREDQGIPLDDIKRQLRNLQNAQLCILENSGHMGMYERQEESMKALINFADKISHKKRSS